MKPKDVPEFVLDLCRKLTASGFQAWLVGGAVRDMALGRAIDDFDLATSARPDEMKRVFGAKRSIPTGEKHGTLTILPRTSDGRPVEITTFRGEQGHSDGRRPDEIFFVSDLAEDLRRRDFTINAMAYDPLQDRFSDPFQGMADLAARSIRTVGDAKQRFSEDGLRVMRAVRLSAQLDFAIEAATARAIPGSLEVFRRVSPERVRDELVKLLLAPRPSVGLAWMEKTGLLAEVLPELSRAVGLVQNRFHHHDVWTHTLKVVDAAAIEADSEAPFLLRLGALLHDVAKPVTAAPHPDYPGENTFYQHDQVGAKLSQDILTRLRFSNRDRESVCHLVRHHMFWYTPDWSDAAVRRFLQRVGEPQFEQLMRLREADIVGRGRNEDPASEVEPLRERVRKEKADRLALHVRDLAVGGLDLMNHFSRPAGKWLGLLLERLLDQVLEDPGLNNQRDLLALADRLDGDGQGG